MLPGDATDYYRCSGVLEFIKHPQIDFNRLQWNNSIGWESLCGLDILIVQRPFKEADLNLIKMAKDMNIRVISDFDDDLLNIPPHNASYELYERNLHHLIECIKESDEIWVSTVGIKDVFKQFNDNIHIIENAHNDYLFPVDKKREFNMEGKLAVYRGGPSHSEDVYDEQRQIIKKINDTPDWEFRFIGSRFSAIEVKTGNNHTFTHPMTIMQFFNYLYDSNPNALFFPLLNNQFNHCKSNISWLEATYAGAAFYGNTTLTEFSNMTFILPVEDFYEYKLDKDVMRFYNETSWAHIKSELLLSHVNKQRVKRLL